MSRLPVRLRITAAFAVAMAVVLAASGLFLYLRLADERGKVLRAQLQLAVERMREMRRQAQIEEQARTGKHGGHPERKGRRHPQPDRQPAHEASTARSR